MHRLHLFAFTAALSLAACAEPPTLDDAGPAPLLPTKGSAVPGSYLVGLHPTAAHLVVEAEVDRRDPRPPVATIAAELAALPGVRVIDPLGHAVRAIAIEADADGLELVRADPRVAYVEEDALGTPASVQTSAPWGLDRIDQRARPTNGRYYYQNPSPAPHVYIIDSGVRGTHAQWSGRVGNGASFEGSDPWADCSGHGTHVAGIAVGSTYGVAKNAILHSVRLTDAACASSVTRAVQALNWVAANRQGFAVANMSWAFFGSTTIDAAATGLINTGVPLVVAAGNDGGDACVDSPGRLPAAITVGATTSTDARWVGTGQASRIGACLDLFAPGASILSADKDSNTDTLTRSGTSMASPFVAGAIARYFADKPGYTPAQMACIAFGGAGCADPNGAATIGVVTNPGAGSPNKLLFIPGPAPRITTFTCPDWGNSGANQYQCNVAYSSEAPATIAWSGGGSASSIFRTCTTGSIVTVTVTVGNDFGADTRTASFACPVGPLP
jgi:subtilisin family serine protease